VIGLQPVTIRYYIVTLFTALNLILNVKGANIHVHVIDEEKCEHVNEDALGRPRGQKMLLGYGDDSTANNKLQVKHEHCEVVEARLLLVPYVEDHLHLIKGAFCDDCDDKDKCEDHGARHLTNPFQLSFETNDCLLSLACGVSITLLVGELSLKITILFLLIRV